jgi:DNA-binding NarL/FixJ family response regulator
MVTLNDGTVFEPAQQVSRNCRVLLINEHRILREAVRLIVNMADGFEVVGDADSATKALQLIEALQPDLVVTELPLPDRSDARFIGELLTSCPHAAILVISAVRNSKEVTATMRAGALGYIRNDAGRAELLNALREVAAGRRYRSKSFDSQPCRNSPIELTYRQIAVLRLVALGYHNTDIADRLGVTPKAVQQQRARLMELLDLHGTAALTAYAVRKGLVSESRIAHGL